MKGHDEAQIIVPQTTSQSDMFSRAPVRKWKDFVHAFPKITGQNGIEYLCVKENNGWQMMAAHAKLCAAFLNSKRP